MHIMNLAEHNLCLKHLGGLTGNRVERLSTGGLGWEIGRLLKYISFIMDGFQGLFNNFSNVIFRKVLIL